MLIRKYIPLFSRFFSSSTVKDLACSGNSDLIDYTVNKSGIRSILGSNFSYEDLFEKVYSILFEHYRNEYVYKNAIANKILIGRHSINTSTLLSEFRVGECKADIVILNGTSCAYEIKTELDSLERLQHQANEYQKMFDLTCIVTYHKNVENILEIVDGSIGVLVLTDDYTIRDIRKPMSNKKHVDQSTIFNSLRKPEYCRIIKEEYGEIPDVPNTKIFSESKKLFEQIPPERAHDYMVQVLKNRSCKKDFKDFVVSLPHSLKTIGLTSGLSKKERENFQSLLHQSI